jgi:hypothetical protein
LVTVECVGVAAGARTTTTMFASSLFASRARRAVSAGRQSRRSRFEGSPRCALPVRDAVISNTRDRFSEAHRRRSLVLLSCASDSSSASSASHKVTLTALGWASQHIPELEPSARTSSDSSSAGLHRGREVGNVLMLRCRRCGFVRPGGHVVSSRPPLASIIALNQWA